MRLLSWLKSWLSSARDKRLASINAPVTPPPTLKPEIIRMTEPAVRIYQQSPDYRSHGDKARSIDLIVLHCTESSWASALAWLTRKDETPVSAHYQIGKDGRLVQMVAVNDMAFHAGGTKEKPSSWRGRGGVNARSIGVELENKNDGKDPYTKIQIEVLLWLVYRKCKAHGIIPQDVVGHCDVDPGRKIDPRGFPFDVFRTSLAHHLNQQGETA